MNESPESVTTYFINRWLILFTMVYSSVVRNKIIEVLASRNSLRAKEIYNKLKLDISYQAAVKMIKTMVDEAILDKEGLDYRLNKDFVIETISFAKTLEKNYVHQYYDTYNKITKDKEIVEVKFTKIVEIYEYIFGFLNYVASGSDKKEPLVAHVRNMFGFFCFSPDTQAHFKDLIDKTNLYVVVKTKNEWNNTISKLWQKLGARVICGLNFGGKDTICFNDIIIQISVEDTEMMEELNEFTNELDKLSGLNMNQIIHFMHERDTVIKVRILTDYKVANFLRKNTLKEF